MTAYIVVYAYAAVVALVGTLGYVLKQSMPSLIAGIAAAIVLCIAGRGIQQGAAWGFPIALVVTLLLLGRFASTYMRAQPQVFWPNGFMALVSLVALIALFATRSRS